MANKNKNNDPLLDKVKKGLKYVESSRGIQMMNPHSSATGFYGQLYNAEELENIPYLQGVDRQSFASDTTLQNRLFEDRYYDRIPGVPGLGKNADDLRVEYKKVLEDKGIPFNYADDEISALSNLLGRQGAREYFGYVLRDGRSLEDVFPKIYGPDAEAPNKTPEDYLTSYRTGRDLKYGGQVTKYQNGGETDPPTGGLAQTYNLQPAMDWHTNRLNNPLWQNRLRKEYSNAHGIDLTDEQMSGLVSGGTDMINTGGNTATYTEEGMKGSSSNAGGFMNADYIANPLTGNIPAPSLGQISLRPGLDQPLWRNEGTTESVAKHEVGHRYNSALGTPFSSSEHSPLIDQSTAYHQSFFNKPWTQGQYSGGEDKSDYYRTPHEIKSYKLQLEDVMDEYGLWNPMKSEFDQGNLRSLINSEDLLSGPRANVMTQGLGLHSLARTYQDIDPYGFNANPRTNSGAASTSFEGNRFDSKQVPLLDSKGIPLGETTSRANIDKHGARGSNYRDIHSILGGSPAHPLTPDNRWDDPEGWNYQGYGELTHPYYSKYGMGSDIPKHQGSRSTTSDVVKGSHKNFRNFFNKGMSYKDIKDRNYSSTFRNVTGLVGDINQGLRYGEDTGFNAYWNNELQNNPELKGAYDRMSTINQEMLDKYKVPYRTYKDRITEGSISPVSNVSDELSRRDYKKAVKQNAHNIADFFKTGYKEQTGSNWKTDERLLMDAYNNIKKGYQQSSYRDMPALEREIKDSYDKRNRFQTDEWMDFIPDIDGAPARDIGENTIQFMNEVAMEDQPSIMTAKYGGQMKKINKYENGGEDTPPEKLEYQINPNMFPQGTRAGYSPYSHVDYGTGEVSEVPGFNMETLKMMTIGSPPLGGWSTKNALRDMWKKTTTSPNLANGGSYIPNYGHGGSREVTGSPIIPGMNFQSDVTRTTSPLLDPEYLRYMLGNQPGAETPFDYRSIMNEDLFLNQYRNEIMNQEPTSIRGLNLSTREGKAAAGYAQGGSRYIPQAGLGDIFGKGLWKGFGKQVGTGLAGVADSLTMGALPMEKIVGENAMEDYGESFKMGKRFGTAVGILGGAGAFSAAGAAGGAGAAGAAGGAGATGAGGLQGLSSVPGANTFNSLYGSGINPNLMQAGTSSSTANVGEDLFNMFQQESSGMMSDNPASNPYYGGYARGGKINNMKQDIGQDANVESGEIMLSAKGGQFQSLNPNAPIEEIIPGVSEVKGNVENDGVPVNLPGDDTTVILSKKLGFADKAKKLIQQYKDLFNQKDTGDVIADEGKKMTLAQIKRKIMGYYKEQEQEKRKKGLTNEPLQAQFGEWFQKGKDWLGTESGKNTMNFLGQNVGTFTNLGRAALSKDPASYNIEDYTTQYIPQKFNVDTAAIMAPINQSEAATRYAIGRGGGSAADIIQGNLATTAKVAPLKASTEAKVGVMENQFLADQYLRKYESDVANKQLALNMRGFNEKRGLARQMHLNEGLTGLQEYFTGRRKEEFMKGQAPFGNYGSSGNYIGGNSGGYTPWQGGSNQAPTFDVGTTQEWFQNNPLGTFNP